MKRDFILRRRCVLCNSTKLKKVLNFKKTPLANSYVDHPGIKEKTFPLVCVLCSDCKHLQLQHLIKPELLFEDYMYVSGTSPVLVKHFERGYGHAEKTTSSNGGTGYIVRFFDSYRCEYLFFKTDFTKKVLEFIEEE